MTVYEFLKPDQIQKIKKSDIRNVKLANLTFLEVAEMSVILKIPHEKLLLSIWKAI